MCDWFGIEDIVLTVELPAYTDHIEYECLSRPGIIVNPDYFHKACLVKINMNPFTVIVALLDILSGLCVAVRTDVRLMVFAMTLFMPRIIDSL